MKRAGAGTSLDAVRSVGSIPTGPLRNVLSVPNAPFVRRLDLTFTPRRLLVQLYPGLVAIGWFGSTWTEEPTFAFENDPESIRLLPAKDPS